MGPPPRSFAADAHDCIMVRVSTDPTEYKAVARASAPAAELPSDRPDTEIRSCQSHLTTQAPYKGIYDPCFLAREGLVPSLTRWAELAALLTLEDRTPRGQKTHAAF